MVCPGAHTVAGTMVMSGIEPVRRQPAGRAPVSLPQLRRSTPRPAADGPMAAPPPVPVCHLPFDRAAMVRRSLKLRGQPRRRDVLVEGQTSQPRTRSPPRAPSPVRSNVRRRSQGGVGGTDLHSLLAEPEQAARDGGHPAEARGACVPRAGEGDSFTQDTETLDRREIPRRRYLGHGRDGAGHGGRFGRANRCPLDRCEA